jgi:hypothetical protein
LGSRALSMCVMWQRHEADHSFPSAKVTNAWRS